MARGGVEAVLLGWGAIVCLVCCVWGRDARDHERVWDAELSSGGDPRIGGRGALYPMSEQLRPTDSRAANRRRHQKGWFFGGIGTVGCWRCFGCNREGERRGLLTRRFGC